MLYILKCSSGSRIIFYVLQRHSVDTNLSQKQKPSLDLYFKHIVVTNYYKQLLEYGEDLGLA